MFPHTSRVLAQCKTSCLSLWQFNCLGLPCVVSDVFILSGMAEFACMEVSAMAFWSYVRWGDQNNLITKSAMISHSDPCLAWVTVCASLSGHARISVSSLITCADCFRWRQEKGAAEHHSSLFQGLADQHRQDARDIWSSEDGERRGQFS